MSKLFALVLFVFAMLMSACSGDAGADWRNTQNPLQQVECGLANKTDGVCANAPAASAPVQAVEQLFKDKVYDNKGHSIGTSCDADDVSNYQSPNGSWTAVCNATVSKCDSLGGSISVNDRGFAYCSATLVLK